MKKALSYNEIKKQEFEIIPFTGDWQKLLGNPAYGGVWFIWADSGNGKSSFVMQLVKQFCLFGKKVIYNALEEYQTKSFRDRLDMWNMGEVKSNWGVVKEQIEAMEIRAAKKRSADIIVIDSIQYLRCRKERLLDFFEANNDKTIIVVSQSTGGRERGKLAEDVNFDADIKVYVDKYVAYMKGRETPPKGGGEYEVHPEMAERLGYKSIA